MTPLSLTSDSSTCKEEDVEVRGELDSYKRGNSHDLKETPRSGASPKSALTTGLNRAGVNYSP